MNILAKDLAFPYQSAYYQMISGAYRITAHILTLHYMDFVPEFGWKQLFLIRSQSLFKSTIKYTTKRLSVTNNEEFDVYY